MCYIYNIRCRDGSDGSNHEGIYTEGRSGQNGAPRPETDRLEDVFPPIRRETLTRKPTATIKDWLFEQLLYSRICAVPGNLFGPVLPCSQNGNNGTRLAIIAALPHLAPDALVRSAGELELDMPVRIRLGYKCTRLA